jgi:hypothetical protein
MAGAVQQAAGSEQAEPGCGLLVLPNEVLVHLLRFIALRDVPSVARACRRLHALRAEYVWHALAREHGPRWGELDGRLDRLMGEGRSAAAVRLPRAWPALASTGMAQRVLVAACRHGRDALVRLLLDAPSVNAAANEHEAFRTACRRGHVHAATLLMEATRSQLSDVRTLDLMLSTSMRALPESLGQLTSLQTLDLQECSSLTALPESLGQLTSPQTLDVWGCSSLTALPESLGQLAALRRLTLRGRSSPASLPESLRALPIAR